MSPRSRNYRPPVYTPPADPTDMSQMPDANPERPWFPVAQPPPPGNYGIVMPTGEPTAATWTGKNWWNGYGDVKAIAWRRMPGASLTM